MTRAECSKSASSRTSASVPLVGVAEQVGVADLAADDLRDLLQRAVVGRDRHAFPLAAGLDGDERQDSSASGRRA